MRPPPDTYIQNITPTDTVICRQANSFLQSDLWSDFKARFGWVANAFLVKWTAEQEGPHPLLTLFRRIAPGFGMVYVPWGPELPEIFPRDNRRRFEVLGELARGLRCFLPRNTVFIRFDPPWYAANSETPPVPFRRAAADIQPPDTVLVDLRSTHQEILAAMKPKWRYNIGLAEKRGVTVEQSNEAGIDIFYRLLAETASRDGIAIHNASYYKSLFVLCRDKKNSHDIAHNIDTPVSELRLYTAVHEGETLAAIVVLCRGKQATYLYGASSSSKRNLMAPYALQWRAIQDAKAAGCEVYDLFGIPPNDNPDHPMAGLYRFKTGFGGNIVHRPGSWDYPYRPPVYALFSTAEGFRKKLRDIKKKHVTRN